jgi:hypothetical protein
MCLFLMLYLGFIAGRKEYALIDYSYYSNGTNGENQMLTVTLARNTMTLLHMRTTVNVQLRITNGRFPALVSFSSSFRLTFIELRSDFNFIRQGDDCIAVGTEPVPAGVRRSRARVDGGRCLEIHIWAVSRRMKRWIRNVRWVGFSCSCSV